LSFSLLFRFEIVYSFNYVVRLFKPRVFNVAVCWICYATLQATHVKEYLPLLFDRTTSSLVQFLFESASCWFKGQIGIILFNWWYAISIKHSTFICILCRLLFLCPRGV